MSRIYVIFIMLIGLMFGQMQYAQLGHPHNVPEKTDNNVSTDQQSTVPGRAFVTVDPRRVQELGVTTQKVEIRDLTKTIRTVGIVDVDETRIEHIQTKFSGWIEKLFVDFVGKPVEKNQPLFTVYSPNLYATQEEYLLALDGLEQPVRGKFAQEFEQASRDLLQSAIDRLTLWDISKDQIASLTQSRTPTKTMVIRSPLNGVVLRKTAFIGMNVGPGIMTYSIVDLSRVWVLADIYEDDIALIKLGQQAELTIPAFPGRKYTGVVTFIDYVVGTDTRTAKIRFEFDNEAFDLKPGMYTTVGIKLNMGYAVALPEEALIDTGERKIIFVALGDGHFEPREVKIGFKAGSFYQVLSGISPGDAVVTSAQFLIDSESRLKAVSLTE